MSSNDWNKRNRDRCNAALRRWRARTPDWKQRDRETMLRRLYGITGEQFTGLKRFQGGKCAICGGDDSHRGRELDVDHDHTTGRVRGVLCRRCNLVLGLIDDVSIAKVVGYLTRPPFERFLELARED